MMTVECLELRVESQKRELALCSCSAPQPSTLDPQPRRRGMTLIELLVVIIIITTIVAAAIPLLSPSNDDRRLREAARGVNAFIGGAQSRAISLRRPFGVAIKRVGFDTKKAEDNSVSIELFYVEQLPPYTGFDVNSRASVALNPNLAGTVLLRFITRGTTSGGLPTGWTADLFPPATIHPGDLVEVNGTQYEILPPLNPYVPYDNNMFVAPATGTWQQQDQTKVAILVARPKNDSGQLINPRYDNNGLEIGTTATANRPYWTSPALYKFFRRPTAASDEPYQLPEGTGIDLRASGVGRNNFFYVESPDDPSMRIDNDEGILVMFTPEGRVQRAAYYQTPATDVPFDGPVVDSVFLLIGRRDRTPPPVKSDPTLDPALISAAVTPEQVARLREPLNWLNGSSHWVVIGSQSGRVATIENANASLRPGDPPRDPTMDEFSRNLQIYAAREFTREMVQMGGR
jgi:prepilin-type N-terminal cleavage/methylation domain-containing protein